MTVSSLTPRISYPTPNSTLLSYPIRHTRTTAATTYPRPSSASPEIVIYGHSNGLTFIYRSPPTSASTTSVTASPHDFNCTHTIHLGTAVLALSSAPEHLLAPPTSAADLTPARKLLTSCVLVAATCADRTVRLISMPLDPPEPGTSPEQILTLGGGVSGHQLPATSIALTLLPKSVDFATAAAAGGDMDEEAAAVEDDDDDLIIASASPDNTGLLLLWRIPIPPGGGAVPPLPRFAPKPENLTLYSPATALRFNTSPTSLSRRHQLLVAEAAGVVRLFDVGRGEWLVSVHMPVSAGGSRMRVLDAEWCCGGRGIISIGADGKWGIWDLEGVLKGRMGNLVGWAVEGTVITTTSLLSSTSSTSTSHGATESGKAGSVVSGSTKTTSATSGTTKGATQQGRNTLAAASVAVLQLPNTSLVSSASSLHIEDEAIAIAAAPAAAPSPGAAAATQAAALVYIPSLRKLFRAKALSSSSSSSTTQALVKKGTKAAKDGDGVTVMPLDGLKGGCEAGAGIGFLEDGKVLLAGMGKVAVVEVGEKEKVGEEAGEEDR